MVAAAVALFVLIRGGGREPVQPVPAEWPRIQIAGETLPVHVARTRAERDRLVPPRTTRIRPLTRFFSRYSVPVGVLFVYPEAGYGYRSVHFDVDELGGSQGLIYLTAEGRVDSVHAVDSGGKPYLSRNPVQFALFVPGAWFRSRAITENTPVALPPDLTRGAEPETAPITDPPPATIRVGGKTLKVEIASRAHDRARGLMYRPHIPDGTGMLFLFPTAHEQHFWMRNTRTPLDIAYIDENYVIRNISTMRPHDLDPERKHVSAGPVIIALETRAGWFRDNGVKPGDRLEVDERVRQLQREAEP